MAIPVTIDTFREEFRDSKLTLTGSDSLASSSAMEKTIEDARQKFKMLWAAITLFDTNDDTTGETQTEEEFIDVLHKYLKGITRLHKKPLQNGEELIVDAQEILLEVLKIKALFEEQGIHLVNKKEIPSLNNAFYYGGYEYWKKFFESDTYTFFKNRPNIITRYIGIRAYAAAESLEDVKTMFEHYRGDSMFDDFSDDSLLEIITTISDVESYVRELFAYFDKLPSELKDIYSFSPRNFLHAYVEGNKAAVAKAFKEFQEYKNTQGDSAFIVLNEGRILALITRGKSAAQCKKIVDDLSHQADQIIKDKSRYPLISHAKYKRPLAEAMHFFGKAFNLTLIVETAQRIISEVTGSPPNMESDEGVSFIIRFSISCNGNEESVRRLTN